MLHLPTPQGVNWVTFLEARDDHDLTPPSQTCWEDQIKHWLWKQFSKCMGNFF